MNKQFIYLSDLAEDVAPQAVSEIVQVSRSNNERDDLTGLLIFDGESFCQFLEGPKDALITRLKIIEKDPRHVGFDLLYCREVNQDRLFSDWSIAYASCTDVTLRGFFAGAREELAFERLEAIVPDLDIIQ